MMMAHGLLSECPPAVIGGRNDGARMQGHTPTVTPMKVGINVDGGGVGSRP
jgi:hypothetical protein